MLTITTCRTYPELPSHLYPLLLLLNQRGISSQYLPWQSTQSAFILPICAWDYAQYIDEFDGWLNQSERLGFHFANSVTLMRWNSRKSYLLDLAKHGLPILDSVIIPPQSEILSQLLQQYNWQQAVIKPIIGQSGLGVQKVYLNDLPDLSNYAHDILVQPYYERAEQGEICLIFLNGTFSHAVHRQPSTNEWRANSAYGAKIKAVTTLPNWVIDIAKSALLCLPEMPRYARVDGFMTDTQFVIGELELIEPALYLHTSPNAYERFVAMIEAWYQNLIFS